MALYNLTINASIENKETELISKTIRLESGREYKDLVTALDFYKYALEKLYDGITISYTLYKVENCCNLKRVFAVLEQSILNSVKDYNKEHGDNVSIMSLIREWDN